MNPNVSLNSLFILFLYCHHHHRHLYSPPSMGNGVQFRTKYDQLNGLEAGSSAATSRADGAAAPLDANGQPSSMTVINMDRDEEYDDKAPNGTATEIPMERRQRMGSNAVSLKMHDDDEDDVDDNYDGAVM